MAKPKEALQLKIELRDVDSLKPYARNSRKHSPAQITLIAGLITRFGWTRPLIIRGDDIAAGHGAWMAAKELGLKKVPCINRADLSDKDYRAYVIADNRAAELSTWDNDLLKIELGELKGLNFDIGALGFAVSDFERLLGSAGGSTQANDTLAERFGVPPFTILDSRQGYWQERKRAWLGLGIQSEVGRGANLLKFSDTVLSGGKKRGLTPELGGRVDNPEAVIPNFYKRLKKLGSREAVIAEWEAKQPKGKQISAGSSTGRSLGGANQDGSAFNVKARGKNKAQAIGTQSWVKDVKGDDYKGLGGGFDGTSIFDPVLCELAYRWFVPHGGHILDPFAGGSVRGIVAGYLGNHYTGLDLRMEQIMANQAQAQSIKPKVRPLWLHGDSADLAPIAKKHKMAKADFIFSCPPYGDLERYSDDERDLSTLEHKEFLAAYRAIIQGAVDQLKEDRFACFVVGDFRAPNGAYRNFVGETVAAFLAAGCQLYNEAILVSAIGSLPIRAAKQFSGSRKLGKCHQNVLVFIKGDAKRATKACGKVEISVPLEGEPTEFGERITRETLRPN